MKIKVRWEYTIVLVALLLLGGTYIVWQRASTKLMQVQQETQALQLQIRSYNRQKTTTEQTGLSKETIASDSKAVPDQSNDSDFIKQVNKISNDIGLTIKSIQLNDSDASSSTSSNVGNTSTQVPGSGSNIVGNTSSNKQNAIQIIGNKEFQIDPSIHTLGMDLTLDGTMDQFHKFMIQIQSLPRFVTISNIQTTQNDKDQTNEFRVTIQIYYVDPSAFHKSGNQSMNQSPAL